MNQMVTREYGYLNFKAGEPHHRADAYSGMYKVKNEYQYGGILFLVYIYIGHILETCIFWLFGGPGGSVNNQNN